MLIFSSQAISLACGLSCTSILQSLDCLPAFTHSPRTLEKCYCSALCPSLDTLRLQCASGQLQTDPCGVCLQCAPGFGEQCGGFANSLGVCAGGLGCLVKYRPGLESEHNSTGVCVTEQGAECKDTGSGVSCRPGQLGIPSEFVFCPAPAPPSPACSGGGNKTNRVTTSGGSSGGGVNLPGPGFLFSNSGNSEADGASSGTRRQSVAGTLHTLVTQGQGAVSQGQGVVSLLSQTGVPQAVQDLIGRRRR